MPLSLFLHHLASSLKKDDAIASFHLIDSSKRFLKHATQDNLLKERKKDLAWDRYGVRSRSNWKILFSVKSRINLEHFKIFVCYFDLMQFLMLLTLWRKNTDALCTPSIIVLKLIYCLLKCRVEWAKEIRIWARTLLVLNFPPFLIQVEQPF